MAEQNLPGEYENPYKFNAKELDVETELYYYGARYYNPRLSVWYGVDPLAEKMPSWSPYSYAFDNPVRYIDPDGRAPMDWILNMRSGEVKWFNNTLDAKAYWGYSILHRDNDVVRTIGTNLMVTPQNLTFSQQVSVSRERDNVLGQMANGILDRHFGQNDMTGSYKLGSEINIAKNMENYFVELTKENLINSYNGVELIKAGETNREKAKNLLDKYGYKIGEQGVKQVLNRFFKIGGRGLLGGILTPQWSGGTSRKYGEAVVEQQIEALYKKYNETVLPDINNKSKNNKVKQ